MSASIHLQGKVAVITGASRGIGEAIARTFVAHGARVVLAARKPEALEALAASLGDAALAVPTHTGQEAQCEALIARAVAHFGQVDVLVNNAATNPHFGPITDTDPVAFQKTVDVNIRGYFFMSARAAKLMEATGGGAIVNVASVNGVTPAPLQGIYSITKAAVISMTKAFAKECAAAGIRVNALLPGLTDTKFAATLTRNPAILASVTKMIPMGRAALPEEMAGAVLFLVSPAGSYTTGACLNVDGGYLA